MSLDIFNSLPKTAITEVSLKRGDVLFRQGDSSIGLYRVQSGSVLMQRMTEVGDLVVLHRAMAGTLFAEASLFSEHYHCDAVCTQSGVVQRFQKYAVANALKKDPDFAERFNKLLAVQVQKYRQIIELISIKSAKERVFTAVQVGMLNGTVLEFAAQIGLTHEACYRALSSLVDEGRLVKLGRGCYSSAREPDI